MQRGHREFSVTREVTTGSNTLFNEAVATFTNPVTDTRLRAHRGDGYRHGLEPRRSRDQRHGDHHGRRADRERRPDVLGHVVHDVAGAAERRVRSGIRARDAHHGPVTWKSGTVSAAGSVEFVKSIHVTQGLTTSGVLSDVATLKPSDTGAITSHRLDADLGDRLRHGDRHEVQRPRRRRHAGTPARPASAGGGSTSTTTVTARSIRASRRRSARPTARSRSRASSPGRSRCARWRSPRGSARRRTRASTP